MRIVLHRNSRYCTCGVRLSRRLGSCRPRVCRSATRTHCAPRCNLGNSTVEYHYKINSIRCWAQRVASIALTTGYVITVASPGQGSAIEGLGESTRQISATHIEYNVEAIRDTPYTRGQKLKYGLTEDGRRIRKCEGAAQPNCISTSSTTNLYSPPFETNTKSALESIQDFEVALGNVTSGEYKILASETLDNKSIYRRYKVSSTFGGDVIEVLVQPPPTHGNENATTFYRSQASEVKYVWPIQQPIGDFDAQRKRMIKVKENLGWRAYGDCDVVERYYY
eukprot:jgi/Picsp_1/5437/NSC_02796-R1_protein